MKPNIYCKTTAKGVQSFYMEVQGKAHYLFSQNYRRGIKEYYSNPISVSRALDFSGARGNRAILHTMEKLPAYIRYIEREYDIEVLRKTQRKNCKHNKRVA